MKRAVRLDPADNVVVALSPVAPGEDLDNDPPLTAFEAIPGGHKIALCRIGAGEPVVKYGEVIGVATTVIEAGAHVHIHNLVSARLPGRAEDRD